MDAGEILKVLQTHADNCPVTEDIKEIKEKVIRIDKVLYGNGKVGLVEEVHRNTTFRAELTSWARRVWLTILVTGAGVIITNMLR
jgi:hypothetical protein